MGGGRGEFFGFFPSLHSGRGLGSEVFERLKKKEVKNEKGSRKLSDLRSEEEYFCKQPDSTLGRSLSLLVRQLLANLDRDEEVQICHETLARFHKEESRIVKSKLNQELSPSGQVAGCQLPDPLFEPQKWHF
ncbi:hypothetical protein VNO77_20685 [Canavalia gladiata]|uniref:Uncharacterized protein n=1 Tax=Canavalia gladiata TaxID=3824 RepID=A0AAN9QLG4_CANGL